MDKAKFIAALLPAALQCQKQFGIPASFVIAQGALESRWGDSKLSQSGCNLFGVKADTSWRGQVTILNTTEYVNGKDGAKLPVTVSAKWRCYATWLECMEDHAAFFKQNRRYAECFKQKTGEGWAAAVAKSGYATDPEYAAKLVAVIRANDLARYD